MRVQGACLVYTGASDMDRKAAAADNVNAVWSNALVVVYTPCVESGISYTNAARPFTRVYGFASADTVSPASFLQMRAHKARS